ncbi:GNAT family N-acetyltransferase [Pseudoroseomonas cervicalis]|uniref:GNAT family N-acetyltransferase n=1 Tax=Teichococcus cervicalis TaxID=204525 RepID=UPI0022F1AD20|nr:GNAT family N-acetyltransferase [Pseudoroseomonas cervicalis]WBV45278.1 GNAT family N-acetyltransferase [Pseudoroseomonas cervicalis]
MSLLTNPAPADTALRIRPAGAADGAAILAIILPVIRAGETYSLPPDLTEQAALDYWLGEDRESFVAEDSQGRILGTYYLRANQGGRGGHVCNCGYMTAAEASGRGVARAMCAHSLAHARHRGYRAMQFNFVVSTNHRAVRLWQSLGFAIVGTLPGAFDHPSRGEVDALVMFRRL